MPQRASARGDSDTTLTSRTSARSTSAAITSAALPGRFASGDGAAGTCTRRAPSGERD